MPVLYRSSFGFHARHPWQLALALAGICVGVAVMVAVDLANESVRRAFLNSMDAVNGEATHQVIAGPAGVDEALYVELRVRGGLRNIAPVVEGYAEVANSTLHVLGIDMFAERDFRDYVLQGMNEFEIAGDGGVEEGERVASVENLLRRMLTGPGAVLLSSRTASALGFSVGATFEVMADGRAHGAWLAGLIGADGDRGFDNLLIADIATAQQWLNLQGRLSRIDVRVEGDSRGGLNRIASLLPAEATLLPAAQRSQSVAEMSDAFMTNLTAMSLLALLIGIFLIYNSVGFAVLQRRNLIGVLRALGLTRAGSFRLILAEALVLGVVGAVLGLVLGLLLGQKLLFLVSRSVNDLYFVVHVSEVSASPSSLAKGFVIGLSATVLAAAVPAIEAASYRPRLALSRSMLERRSGRLAPWVAAAGIVMVALGFGLLRLSGSDLVAGLAAVFMLILGLALCIPLVVRGIAQFAAPLASRMGGLGMRLAVSGVGASLSRTGVAIVALAVAVSATIGVTIMVDSFRISVSEWIDQTLRSDIYVGVARGTLEEDLVHDVLQLPDIEDHSVSRRVWLESPAGRTRVTAIDMARHAYQGVSLDEGDPEETWRAFEQQGAVLVSSSYAYRHNAGKGSRVTLPTPSGERQFPVAGVYRSYDADLDALLMSRATYLSIWDDPSIGSVGLYLRDDADVEQVIGRIRKLSDGRQALLISSNRELRERSLQIFDRTFAITGVLYWLALSVAAIGILGAMLALQLERGRELAIYRALGMTPFELGRMVVMQTGFIGLLSGLAAIPLGLTMAWVLVHVINRRAFGWQLDTAVSSPVLVEAIILAVVVATVGGLYPAWRAAQARPAVAMREE